MTKNGPQMNVVNEIRLFHSTISTGNFVDNSFKRFGVLRKFVNHINDNFCLDIVDKAPRPNISRIFSFMVKPVVTIGKELISSTG